MKRTGFAPRTTPMTRCAISPGTAKLTIKPRTCRNQSCKDKFIPQRMGQVACCPGCAIIVGRDKARADAAKAARIERKETKRKLDEFKPLEYWLKITERHCNAYIRERDPDICISCGVTQSSAWQAGHYISVGANKTLRFHEDNIHKQCIHCNMHLASNATEYRIRLIEKIGIERVEFLESWHPPIKMTREAAQDIAADFKEKLRKLKVMNALHRANEGVATNE